MDPNVTRVEEFRKTVDSALACYRLIYNEKARSVTQSTIESFFKPKSSTADDVQSTTSSAADDVMPFDTASVGEVDEPLPSTSTAHVEQPPSSPSSSSSEPMLM